MPLGINIVPIDPFDATAQFEIAVDIIFPGQALPIVSDLAALSKFFRPLRIWRKGTLVDIGRYITSNPGVGVFKPCTTL